MKYQLTYLEEEVKNLYENLCIFEPRQINMKYIADTLDIWISYHDDESKAVKFNGNYYVFLNNHLSVQEEWQDFGHELGHVVKHVGNQHKLRKMFRNLQESQADNFMYHFCVPTFMLLNFNISNYMNIKDGIPFITDNFNVTEEFAKRRLIHFRNQIQQAISDEEHRIYMDSLYPKAPPYTEETNAILAKLYSQLAKKKKGVI